MKRKGPPVTERGKVYEIKGTSIVVSPDKSPACFGCMNQECKSNGGFIFAENPKALDIKGGQTVEVQVKGASLLKQALMALLPPAFGFAAGFILTRLLFPQAGERAAFAGLLFLFISAFVIFKVRAKIPAGKIFTVSRIIC